jgi:hypothetical protein
MDMKGARIGFDNRRIPSRMAASETAKISGVTQRQYLEREKMDPQC